MAGTFLSEQFNIKRLYKIFKKEAIQQYQADRQKSYYRYGDYMLLLDYKLALRVGDCFEALQNGNEGPKHHNNEY